MIFAAALTIAIALLTYGTLRYSQGHAAAAARIPSDDNLIRLTNDVASDNQPDWSPDGSKIVFVRNRGGGLPAIWVMDSSGANPLNLTATLGRSDSPAWSPDGKRIAFQRKRGVQPELFVINADGSDPAGR